MKTATKSNLKNRPAEVQIQSQQTRQDGKQTLHFLFVLLCVHLDPPQVPDLRIEPQFYVQIS
ncbi:MAG: hypothetical protein AAFY91_14190 [Bacteroidota bacterium]